MFVLVNKEDLYNCIALLLGPILGPYKRTRVWWNNRLTTLTGRRFGWMKRLCAINHQLDVQRVG